MSSKVRHAPYSKVEIDALIQEWSKATDFESAITTITFIEDRLGFALLAKFVPLPKTGNKQRTLTQDALFEGFGPLASFYAKIDMGFALGIYHEEIRQDLHCLRSVRNEFAHSMRTLDFDSPAIIEKMSRINVVQGRLDISSMSTRDAFMKTVGYFAGWLDGWREGFRQS